MFVTHSHIDGLTVVVLSGWNFVAVLGPAAPVAADDVLFGFVSMQFFDN